MISPNSRSATSVSSGTTANHSHTIKSGGRINSLFVLITTTDTARSVDVCKWGGSGGEDLSLEKTETQAGPDPDVKAWVYSLYPVKAATKAVYVKMDAVCNFHVEILSFSQLAKTGAIGTFYSAKNYNDSISGPAVADRQENDLMVGFCVVGNTTAIYPGTEDWLPGTTVADGFTTFTLMHYVSDGATWGGTAENAANNDCSQPGTPNTNWIVISVCLEPDWRSGIIDAVAAGGAGETLNFNLTIGSAYSNLRTLAAVAVAVEWQDDLDEYTIGGVTLDKVGEGPSWGGTPSGQGSLYYKVAPGTGAKQIHLHSANGHNITAVAASIYGVSPKSTYTGSNASDNGSDAEPHVDLTGSNWNFGLLAVGCRNDEQGADNYDGDRIKVKYEIDTDRSASLTMMQFGGYNLHTSPITIGDRLAASEAWSAIAGEFARVPVAAMNPVRWMFFEHARRLRQFYDDLKRGEVPHDLLERRYRQLVQI